MAGAAQALRLQFHQPLGGKADHLPQQGGIEALLQEFTKGNTVIGHRGRSKVRVAGLDNPTLPKITAMAASNRAASSYTTSSYTTYWDTTDHGDRGISLPCRQRAAEFARPARPDRPRPPVPSDPPIFLPRLNAICPETTNLS
jgi:hypothetical protein